MTGECGVIDWDEVSLCTQALQKAWESLVHTVCVMMFWHL